jgi:hypothetical protein
MVQVYKVLDRRTTFLSKKRDQNSRNVVVEAVDRPFGCWDRTINLRIFNETADRNNPKEMAKIMQMTPEEAGALAGMLRDMAAKATGH